MNRILRQNDGLDWAFILKCMAGVVAVMVVVTTVFALLILWDYREARDRSIEARMALLEREAKRRTRPIIQVQNASVYSMEGELILETHPARKQ